MLWCYPAGEMGTAGTKTRPRAERRARKAKVDAARKEGKCGAEKRNGERCAKPAGWGTNHVGIGSCKLHGGSTAKQVKGAQVVVAKEAVVTYGLPVDVEPHQALLDELTRTAGHVAWLAGVVADLEEQELVGPIGAEGVDAESGLKHHPRAEANIWVRLYQEERKHLTQVAATCIKAGIEERRTQVAEQTGQLLAQVIHAVLADLKIPPAKAKPVVRKHLTAIAGGAQAA